jgi:subtilase family serine protease
MTATRLSPALLLAASFVLSASISAQTTQQPKARLSAPIADTSRATLAGSQPPRARLSSDLGAVDPSTPLPSITMYFSRSTQQQADLEALVAAQQNPSSPQFHQWLTPAEFGARFGLADTDIARTEAWLQSRGFTVSGVSPSRNSITFAGTAATAASAFGAPLHRYSYQGKNHIAPAADLSLPSSLSGIVADVRGLSDFRPHPHVKHANGALYKPNFTSSQTGNHFLTPGDVAVLYDIKAAWNAGYTGTGQTIAIMGQSAVSPADVTNFQTATGQTAKAPTVILVPNTGSSATYSGDESESDLDLEYASGIAPGATVEFVYVGQNANKSVFDSLTWAIQNRIASILNISYGECEPDLGQSQYNSITLTLQQAAAQGQTIVSASGDDGSTDCYIGQSEGSTDIATEEQLAVDFPSSSQYVTALGGTELPAADVASGNNAYFSAASGSDVVVSALAYDPNEMAWNDDSASEVAEYGLSSGGGGVSIFTAAPSWQTGVPGIPSGGAFRLVPDVALDASPNNAPYAYCSSDSSAWASGQTSSCSTGLRDSNSQDLTVAGGTSFASPIFAGMLAIIGQAKGYTFQGVVNPTLYTLASNATTYASAFHDITNGNNECNLGISYCSTADAASFSSAVGYDQATGLGSVDLNNLLNAWPQNSSTTSSAESFTLSSTALSISQSSGVSGTGSASSTITITPQNGYTGTIAWTVTSNATVYGATACYSLPSTTVSGSSPATATLTVNTEASGSCPSGMSALKQKGTTSAAAHRPASPAQRSPAVPVLAGLGLASLALFGLFPAARRNRRLPTLLALILLAGAGLGLSGCGGGMTASGIGIGTIGGTGSSATTNYTITVIGTDTANSAITASTTLAFTLTVQ